MLFSALISFSVRGSPPTIRNWRYNRVWHRERIWTRKDTPRQNEALLSIKNTNKHQTEKGRDREYTYVKDRRHYKIWHKNKQQNHTYNRDPREVKVFLEQSSQLVKFKVGHGHLKQISNHLSTAVTWEKYTSHSIKHQRTNQLIFHSRDLINL